MFGRRREARRVVGHRDRERAAGGGARQSVTVQFTVVVPIAKVEPEAGTQTAAIGPSSTSLPVAVKVHRAPAALVAAVVMFAGGVNVGALLVTVTVNEPSRSNRCYR